MVDACAGGGVSWPTGGVLSQAPDPPHSGQAAGDLGWRADPSRPARQGLSGPGRRPPHPPGAVPRLRA